MERLNDLTHDIARIVEAIKQENIRHSKRIMELDMALIEVKFKIQGELPKVTYNKEE